MMETIAHLDAPVRTLLDRIAGPASLSAATPDMVAIGAAVRDLALDTDYLGHWIERLGDTSGVVRLHAPERGPRVMLAHRLEGQMGAVHDHRTWVALAPVTGLETHRRYHPPADPDGMPTLAGSVELAPSDVATLVAPDDIHDHGHVTGRGAPAYVLIVTGDDQARFERREWDLESGRSRILRPGDIGRWVAAEAMPDA